MNKTFYVTTPIYYPSERLHIGNAYSTVFADALARFHRMQGEDVMYLTGTDEHGLKLLRRAEAAGVTPIEYIDGIVASIKQLWSALDISYDDFIRTTQPRHEAVVQKVLQKLYDQGDIYKGHYEGWYCTPCESYWTEAQLTDGKCPECERAVERTREDCYYLRTSKYAPALIDYIEAHPEFIQPSFRASEMMGGFLKPGLQDLAISRTNFDWGVKLPFDEGHILYVWVDALINYASALGYLSEDDGKYKRFWPADVHVIGKDIVRFHTIVWPIMLLALGEPLPKTVYAHGFLLLDGGKMSKSKGNVIDPELLCSYYGSDAIRYFLLREASYGADTPFSNETMLTRINSDLANDLGNLVSRTVAMIEKYFGGTIPAPTGYNDVDQALIAQLNGLRNAVKAQMDALQISNALAAIFKATGELNRYVDVTQPWILGKAEDGPDRERLKTVMHVLAEGVRLAAVLLTPFMPQTPARIFEHLGVTDEGAQSWASAEAFGDCTAGCTVKKGAALFPRMDIAKEMERLAPDVKAK